MSKAQTIYWLSLAVLAFAPLSMAIRPLSMAFRPLGFFDGPKGD